MHHGCSYYERRKDSWQANHVCMSHMSQMLFDLVILSHHRPPTTTTNLTNKNKIKLRSINVIAWLPVTLSIFIFLDSRYDSMKVL